MSIHVSGGRSGPRRVVVSCDVAGCPVQTEPAAAESWRSDLDAISAARDNADGWARGPDSQTDYCPEHAGLAATGSTSRARPTAAARGTGGDPRDRDEYAAALRGKLAAAEGSTDPMARTAGQAAVIALLLDELAGVYRDEDLGRLAHELSHLMSGTR